MIGKAYRVIRPLPNDPPDMLRVVDEDAEDYLYSSRQFVSVELPPQARRVVAAAVSQE